MLLYRTKFKSLPAIFLSDAFADWMSACARLCGRIVEGRSTEDPFDEVTFALACNATPNGRHGQTIAGDVLPDRKHGSPGLRPGRGEHQFLRL
jgi:hypothetical protein